ncbi:tryptophan--tRNA ligase [Sphaerisporangium krabiense]|uniref:Tryptophan--tRNA ligase n=1 Tax=Sphaerisporangium krabiense TaxID=763782 RepID=A0A7W9DQB8_9ACTN|nr:tryptophan--tRNA ligase [Sphaerisporangium krabiense]MBB5626230.1 tryptophanyl-tRNA synthetase [Sphaerisporangium krabiense]GII66103.1 tryptophan--tRNA ligase [Sphaerisporangium krabiense]
MTDSATSANVSKPRVLSGITATGKLTIGNYIGALSVWAAEQDRYENFFFIADLHALTIPENIKADALRERIKEIVALYLACGLDPAKSVLFQQSRVPAHASLAWIFDCVTPVGWLERMTQYKSKSQTATPSAGLFTYPALMAADILLYQAAYVPVGDDQRQHIEITRDIAQRFNHLFGEAFRVPEPLIRASGARIMGLDDPTVKMSKSLAETRDGHAIGLLDPPSKIRKAVMRAVTDSGSEVRGDAIGPGVDNLLTLFEVLSGTDRASSLRQFEGQGYGTLKKAVAEVAIERVGAIQSRYTEIRADETYLEKTLIEGAEKATAVADRTLSTAMRLTGLL